MPQPLGQRRSGLGVGGAVAVQHRLEGGQPDEATRRPAQHAAQHASVAAWSESRHVRLLTGFGRQPEAVGSDDPDAAAREALLAGRPAAMLFDEDASSPVSTCPSGVAVEPAHQAGLDVGGARAAGPPARVGSAKPAPSSSPLASMGRPSSVARNAPRASKFSKARPMRIHLAVAGGAGGRVVRRQPLAHGPGVARRLGRQAGVHVGGRRRDLWQSTRSRTNLPRRVGEVVGSWAFSARNAACPSSPSRRPSAGSVTRCEAAARRGRQAVQRGPARRSRRSRRVEHLAVVAVRGQQIFLEEAQGLLAHRRPEGGGHLGEVRRALLEVVDAVEAQQLVEEGPRGRTGPRRLEQAQGLAPQSAIPSPSPGPSSIASTPSSIRR